jgi:beta-galactosidase/beta-glucuronidase
MPEVRARPAAIPEWIQGGEVMGRTVVGRASIDLDGAWRFTPDPDASLGPDDAQAGLTIDVPGCWEAQSADWRGVVTGWYRRELDVPGDWQGSRVVLAFGAVMYHATVYLNGRILGEHEGGYTSFELDAQDAIDWGGTNELAVRVVNPMGDLTTYPAGAAEFAAADARIPVFPLYEVPHG